MAVHEQEFQDDSVHLNLDPRRLEESVGGHVSVVIRKLDAEAGHVQP